MNHVSLCYRLAKQRIPTFKELAIHWLKGTLSYHELWALRDVDTSIVRGEMVGIMGRNGAGKSTLLKVVSGVLQPTRGEVAVEGTVAPILELGAGFDYELTGLENIYLNALLLGHSRRSITAEVEGIVEFSELEEFIHSPVRNYSTGMLSRLGFSVATAWVPEVLLLDEVLAVGDAAFTLKCQQRMRRFLDAGTTVLLVSHDERAIRKNCTRAIWIDGGRIVEDGEPDRVCDAYAAAAARAAHPAHPQLPRASSGPGA